ncbi:MAG: hypothetical protein JRG73_14845 [Deltaproteobacteria bacterium]|nr:hypothetical protein [Deltaproteobacteria bacterium]MBW2308201.1 hypothetical protein [Deltaproteobacteria bacterium]
MKRKVCILIAVGLALQLGMMTLVRHGQAQSRGKVHIWVRAVAASNAGKHTDPRLQDIRRKLDTLFRYTSYSVISEVKRTIIFGKGVRMSLRTGRKLTVTPRAFEKGMIRMDMKIVEGNRVTFKTNLRLANGGTLLIGGPRQGKEVIIFAITARVQ